MKYLNKTSALGENTADNRFDSSNVVSNEDGSALERLEHLKQGQTPLADFILIDKDLFEDADADADTARWDVGYITAGSSEASANINTTTSGQLMMKYTTPSDEQQYYVRRALPVYGDNFQITADLDVTWGATDSANAKRAELILTKTTTYDSTNYLSLSREKGTSINRIRLDGKLNNVAIFSGTPTDVTTTDDALAFKIERWPENIYKFFYSLTQDPTYTWVFIDQVEDPSNRLTNELGFFFSIYTKGTGVAETVLADWDNWKLYAGAGGGGQFISGNYDSTWVTSDADGNVFEREEVLQSDLIVLDAIVDTLVTVVSDIGSDINVIDANLITHDSDVMSDLETIASDLLLVDAVVDTVSTNLITHDSDVMSDLETLRSDLVVLDGIVDTIASTQSTDTARKATGVIAYDANAQNATAEAIVDISDVGCLTGICQTLSGTKVAAVGQVVIRIDGADLATADHFTEITGGTVNSDCVVTNSLACNMRFDTILKVTHQKSVAAGNVYTTVSYTID